MRRVAAAHISRGRLYNQYVAIALGRADRRTNAGIATAHNNDIP